MSRSPHTTDLTPAECMDRLRRYVEERDFSGYDPYDALSSPLLRMASLGSKYGRIALTQALRRLPVNLRPLLLVPRGHNPKGIALFLWGYARLYALHPSPELRGRIDSLAGLLDRLRSRCTGHGWGYNFPWQSRTTFTPAFTPTVVNTGFIGHALLDAHEITRQSPLLDLALPAAEFLLTDLNRTIEGDTFCFSYTPNDRSIVHNANLLGASLLARLSRLADRPDWMDLALRSARYTVNRQRSDGSWYYADTRIQQWIDSFHTAFNLQALRWLLAAADSPTDLRESYRRGLDYYTRTFFGADGTPAYYHDRVYPIDIHSPTQAVAFLAGEGPPCRDLTDRVLNWMVRNLFDAEQGYFYFRRSPRGPNRVPYMRWSQAWAFHALAEYLFNSRPREGSAPA